MLGIGYGRALLGVSPPPKRYETLIKMASLGVFSLLIVDARPVQTRRGEKNDFVDEISGDALVPSESVFVTADRVEPSPRLSARKIKTKYFKVITIIKDQKINDNKP